MAFLQVKEFSGIIPMTGDRAIPDNFAVDSVNTWLYGNELRGLRPPVDLITMNTTTRKVFRIPKRTVGGNPDYPTIIPPPSYLGDSVWVQFTDPFTDIVKGALIEDQYERYYFCSPTTGPQFNTYARLQSGLPAYKLGVPGPDATLDASGNNAWTPTIVSINQMARSTDIYEIEFKIGTAVNATAYTNPGGSGNRAGVVTVSGTVTWSGGAAQLVDGNLANVGNQITNFQAANKTVVFDFATAKFIDELKWYQSDRLNYGEWKWQGSTDNTNWVDIRSGNLGGLQQQTYSVPTATAYRYYRMLQAAVPAPVNVTRSYVYTWVNEFGEESTPSLPVTGSGGDTATWRIGNICDPPTAAGYPAYSKKYLYRTITGASGQTTYYRVATIPLGTTVYDDNSAVMTDAILASNLTLESTTWALPPATLKGWIAMPNGFLIGFDGNTVYMSESYHFHAWPAEYKQATETPIVGLGVLGQTCVVCTQGYPATITGVKPATCAFTKSNSNEPCLSRGSIVSTPDGVVYASINGLIIIGPNGILNATKELITRDDWQKDFTPQYLRAVRYQDGYLALRMPPAPDVRSAFFLDPTALKVALTELSDFELVLNVCSDFWSGEVFMIFSGQVKQWDPPSEDLMPTLWLSKEYQYPFQENFGCYAIYWDDARYKNNAYATDIMPSDEKVRFRAFADRRLVYDEEVPRNGRGVRLGSGFKADIWQFEIRARAPVYSLHVASTMKELKSV